MRADVGSAAWISCAGHLPFGQPDDQRSDDAWSLVYDWELDEELEILGHPRLAVRVGSSAPVAFLSAKLCDVFPDGTSALVARGFLNLAQRRSRTDPEPMRPGVVEAVELELDATSWVFPAGHRLRLSLAGTDWPNLVPPPAPVTLTVERDGSALTLPALDGPSPSPPPSLPPPRPADRQASTPNPLGGGRTMSPQDPQSTGGLGMSPPDPPTRWRVVRDVLGRGTEAEIDHGGRTELPDGAVLVERYQGTVGHGAGPGADLGPRVGQLPRRVAGGDRRHQRPARPAWRRRRLRGPARPGGPRGRRAPLGPDLAPPHPPPPLLTSATEHRRSTRPRHRSGSPPAGPLSAERGIDPSFSFCP